LYTNGGTFIPKSRHIAINWGRSSSPDWSSKGRCRIINQFDRVKIASNKLETFNVLSAAGNVCIPEYTTDRNVALQWLTNGILVVCRTKLNGHSGAGIVLASREEDLPDNCPLYVKYIKKVAEYRVHVAFGKAIDVQHKRKLVDYRGTVDYAVRNHHTGWVYCREGVEVTDPLKEQAVAACLCLGLDFGAVDIIYNRYHDTYTVLEVNTAPGLEGTSIENYAKAFYEEFS
jgi:glutathione synthase/RimK-type ligase-like ATP-grasp enzyme